MVQKAHLLFEQSGTFKNEFIKLGIPAFDYDIQNKFNETDHVIDLFSEIEKAYSGGASIFDSMSCDDLIMAFFPCIYFEAMQMPYYSLSTRNICKLSTDMKFATVIDRAEKRHKLYILLWKLFAVVNKKGLRMIVENPATQPHYLLFPQNFIRPTFIDKNRQMRGDYFRKPTAYWYVNIEPTYGESFQEPTKRNKIGRARGGKGDGLCSKERSMMSPDYARNFIHDFILGKPQKRGQPSLFDL